MDARTRSAAVQSSFTLLGAIASLAFLGLQLKRVLEPKVYLGKDLIPIAKLEFESNTVERKFFREVLWNDVEDSEPLYLRDAIRTGPESEARIRFDDGTELSLLENSLVVLERDEGQIRVDFQQGAVSAKAGTGKGFAIRTGEGLIRVSEADGKSGAIDLRGAGEDVVVAVEGGRAEIETQTGKTQIGVDELGSLSKNGGVQTRKLDVELQYPVSGAKIIRQLNKQEVGFLWKLKNNLSNLRIQIARDPDFQRIEIERPVRQSQFSIKLSDGMYYWRIVTRSENNEIEIRSKVSHFSIFNLDAPTLLTPENEQRASYMNDPPVIDLVWSHSGAQDIEYTVELSNSENFSTLQPMGRVNRQRSFGGETRLLSRWIKPMSGEWFWRVKASINQTGIKGNERVERVSLIRRFKVIHTERLDAPILVEPFHKKALGIESKKEKVLFHWEPVQDARSYLFEMSDKSDFSNKIISSESVTTEWNGVIPVQGRVFWRVKARIGKGVLDKESAYSKTFALFVSRSGGLKLESPKESDLFQYVENLPTVIYSWEPFVGARAYRVEWALRPDFKKIVYSEVVEENRFESAIVKKPGTYYWRVFALGKDDQVIALSEPSRFILKQELPPQPLEKLKPQENEIIKMPPIRKIEFEWKTDKKSKQYEWKLERIETNGKVTPLFQEKMKEIHFQKELPPGRYRWDVRGVDVLNRTGEWGIGRDFEVILEGVLPASVIQSPLSGTFIERSVPEIVPLKWVPVEGAVAYLLTINGAPVRPLLKDTVYAFKAPRSGKYHWKIQAIGKDKKAGLAVEGDFTVKWRALLSAPKKIRVQFTEDEP